MGSFAAMHSCSYRWPWGKIWASVMMKNISATQKPIWLVWLDFLIITQSFSKFLFADSALLLAVWWLGLAVLSSCCCDYMCSIPYFVKRLLCRRCFRPRFASTRSHCLGRCSQPMRLCRTWTRYSQHCQSCHVFWHCMYPHVQFGQGLAGTTQFYFYAFCYTFNMSYACVSSQAFKFGWSCLEPFSCTAEVCTCRVLFSTISRHQSENTVWKMTQ